MRSALLDLGPWEGQCAGRCVVRCALLDLGRVGAGAGDCALYVGGSGSWSSTGYRRLSNEAAEGPHGLAKGVQDLKRVAEVTPLCGSSKKGFGFRCGSKRDPEMASK